MQRLREKELFREASLLNRIGIVPCVLWREDRKRGGAGVAKPVAALYGFFSADDAVRSIFPV